MEHKYFAVHKSDPLIPQKQLVAILKDMHDRFYGENGINVVGVPMPSKYEEGVAEGIRRCILFIEKLELTKVEWPSENHP